MIKIGIVGGTGYTGVELLRILVRHPQAQLAGINIASAHHGNSVSIFDQARQKMLERCVLVAAFVGVFQRAMQRGFETFREGWHVDLLFLHGAL